MHNDGKKYFFKWREAFPKVTRAVENGIVLRETRKLLNLSQQQLSELTGLSRRRLSEMETGKRLISQEEAQRFATVLNVDYQVFL
jgi:transcriptional regulator with XRE-family HTH domain